MQATRNILLGTVAILFAPVAPPAAAQQSVIIAQAPAPAPAPGDVDPRAQKKEPGARPPGPPAKQQAQPPAPAPQPPAAQQRSAPPPPPAAQSEPPAKQAPPAAQKEQPAQPKQAQPPAKQPPQAPAQAQPPAGTPAQPPAAQQRTAPPPPSAAQTEPPAKQATPPATQKEQPKQAQPPAKQAPSSPPPAAQQQPTQQPPAAQGQPTVPGTTGQPLPRPGAPAAPPPAAQQQPAPQPPAAQGQPLPGTTGQPLARPGAPAAPPPAAQQQPAPQPPAAQGQPLPGTTGQPLARPGAPATPGATPPAAALPGSLAPAPQQDNARRLDQVRGERRESREGDRTVIREPGRIIIQEGGRSIIRHDESGRFGADARDVRTERRGSETVTIIERPDCTRIVTVVDENGRLIRRSRRFGDGREVVIIDNHYQGPAGASFYVDLPPPVIRIPRERYIVEAERASEADIYAALIAPPVDRIERRYTLDEVRYSPRLRERMPRVDLDTVTFDTGSWEIAPDQMNRLAPIAQAILQVVQQNPAEVFLVEGHTDAVGSDIDNLSLSDRRAESVAVALTQQFRVPAENLTTQGYGEQYLKVPTQAAERQNRRVTARRITPLLTGQNQGQ